MSAQTLIFGDMFMGMMIVHLPSPCTVEMNSAIGLRNGDMVEDSGPLTQDEPETILNPALMVETDIFPHSTG